MVGSVFEVLRLLAILFYILTFPRYDYLMAINVI